MVNISSRYREVSLNMSIRVIFGEVPREGPSENQCTKWYSCLLINCSVDPLLIFIIHLCF